jgi:hypothetical protein
VKDIKSELIVRGYKWFGCIMKKNQHFK